MTRSALRILLAGCITLGVGCRSDREAEEQPHYRVRSAGRITTVRAAEHYIIFESAFSFLPGTSLRAMRQGQPVGLLTVMDFAQKPYFAADVVDGDLQVGDLVEPIEQPESGRQQSL